MKLNKRIYKKAFVAGILLASLILLVFAGNALSFQAGVEDISSEKYYPAVKKALSEAKESIFMVMFVVRLMPYDKSSSVYQLMDELVKAHNRGVKVTMILDQNVDFLNKPGLDEWEIEGKNAWCFKMAKTAGIDVFYDNPQKYTHSKTIVIDAETVILGSSNWTESSLHRNMETNVLIKSKGLAKELLAEFNKIERYKKAAGGPQPQQPPIPLCWKFLEDPKLGGRMISNQDERGFDLYLLLLRQFDGNPQGELALDYDKTAKALGLYERMNRAEYRTQITKCLKRLQKKYNLIKFNTEYSKDAIVTLLSYDNPAAAYSYPKEWYFQLPDGFFGYGWNRKLSLAAKYCYLINLAYVSISDARPWWFASREILTKRFYLSATTLTIGMQELRRLNIIDVAYPPFDKKDPSGRLAKSYKLLNLYDPAWLEAEWDRLEMLYGPDILKKARAFAGIVFEENDPEIIEDIIKSINTHGERQVKKAFDIAAKKRVDNPKRCYFYVRGIIDKSGKKLPQNSP